MAPTVDFGPVKYGCTKYKRRMVLYESVSHAGKRFEFCYSSSYRDKRGVETAYYKCVGCMHAKRYNDGRRIPKIAVRENRLVNSNPDRPSNFPHFCHPIDMALSDRRQREREITTQYPVQANRAPQLQLLTLPGFSRRSDSADNSPTCPATAAVFPPLQEQNPQPFMAQQPMAQQQQPMAPMESSATFFQQYQQHQHHQPVLTKAAIQQLLIDGTTMATTMALTSPMESTSAHSTSAGKNGQQQQHLVTQPMQSSSSSSLAASSSMMIGPGAAFLASAQVCRPTPVHHPAAAAVSISSSATATLSGSSHPHENHYYKQLQQQKQQQIHQHLPQFPANFHAAASVQQQIQRLAADCFAQQQQQQEVVRQQQQKQGVEVARQQLFACQQQRQEVARQQQLHHHHQRHHQQFRPNESAIVSAAATAMPLALLGMAAVGGWQQPAATNGSNHHAGGHQPATMNGNHMMFS